jgi:hypothetical protein
MDRRHWMAADGGRFHNNRPLRLRSGEDCPMTNQTIPTAPASLFGDVLLAAVSSQFPFQSDHSLTFQT